MLQKAKDIAFKGNFLQTLSVTCPAAPKTLEMANMIKTDQKIKSKTYYTPRNPFTDESVFDDFE